MCQNHCRGPQHAELHSFARRCTSPSQLLASGGGSSERGQCKGKGNANAHTTKRLLRATHRLRWRSRHGRCDPDVASLGQNCPRPCRQVLSRVWLSLTGVDRLSILPKHIQATTFSFLTFGHVCVRWGNQPTNPWSMPCVRTVGSCRVWVADSSCRVYGSGVVVIAGAGCTQCIPIACPVIELKSTRTHHQALPPAGQHTEVHGSTRRLFLTSCWRWPIWH